MHWLIWLIWHSMQGALAYLAVAQYARCSVGCIWRLSVISCLRLWSGTGRPLDKVVPTFPFSLVNRPPPPVTPHPTPTNQNENMQTNKMPALYYTQTYHKIHLCGPSLGQGGWGGCLKVKPCNTSALMAGLSHHIPNQNSGTDETLYCLEDKPLLCSKLRRTLQQRSFWS